MILLSSLEETLDERKYFSYMCVHVYVLLPHKVCVCVSATLPPSKTLSSVRQSA